jgi:hypothetical protein
MAGIKRFITYIYAYENRTKGINAGFDGEIEGHITYFYGKCADCKQNS